MVLIVRSEWRGRGCSHSCSMGGSWEVSQACSPQVGGGAPCAESEEAAQHCLAYSVLTGECHPCHEGQSPLGQKQHFASSLLFLSSSLLASCPCGEGSCPPFFFRQPPLSLPRSHNQCKGCSRDLRWFLTSPPQKLNREVTSISLPHVAH